MECFDFSFEKKLFLLSFSRAQYGINSLRFTSGSGPQPKSNLKVKPTRCSKFPLFENRFIGFCSWVPIQGAGLFTIIPEIISTDR
jgi:hypothetical protein